MLGRSKRTSRTDVGLALAFAGVAYLMWALVAGICRGLMQHLIQSTRNVPVGDDVVQAIKVFFVDAGFVIDIVGLLWLAVTLLLVYLASRQKISVSWAWMSVVCQAFVAVFGVLLVAYANHGSLVAAVPPPGKGDTAFAKVSSISLGVTVFIAVVLWSAVLIHLVAEFIRFRHRRGPSLRDGLRTNTMR